MSETYHATKYASAAAEVIALMADPDEGYGSTEFGEDGSPVGFVQVVTLDETKPIDSPDSDGMDLADDALYIARRYGVTDADVAGHHVVTHDDQGFVTIRTFPTEQERDDHVTHLISIYSAWDAEEAEVFVCAAPGHGYHEI